MQRSASPPDLVRERVACARCRGSTRWKALRPVAGVHARPDRGVRVHALAGRRARQQLQQHLEVAQRRHDLLDPHHGDQRLGQGRAHPAVALRLDDARRVPVSATREVRAGDRRRARGGTRRAGSAAPPPSAPPRVVARDRRAPSRLAEEVADLARCSGGSRERAGATAVRPRAGRSARRGRSRARSIPASASASFEPDLVRRERLHLDDLVDAGSARRSVDDRVRLGRVARPVHDAARRVTAASSSTRSSSIEGARDP